MNGAETITQGSTGRQLMTAYREKAIRVAAALRSSGESSPASLARQTGVGSAAAILQKTITAGLNVFPAESICSALKGCRH